MKVIDQYFVHSFAAMFSEEINNNTIFKTEFEGYIFSSILWECSFIQKEVGKMGLNYLKML